MHILREAFIYILYIGMCPFERREKRGEPEKNLGVTDM